MNNKPTKYLYPYEHFQQQKRKKKKELWSSIAGWIVIAIIFALYKNGSMDGAIHLIKENWLVWLIQGVAGIVALAYLWKYRLLVFLILILVAYNYLFK